MPEPALLFKVSKQRGLATSDQPCRTTRRDVVAILALVSVDARRREVVRGCTNVHRPPTPRCAPVYWADTGGVYAVLLFGEFGARERRGCAGASSQTDSGARLRHAPGPASDEVFGQL